MSVRLGLWENSEGGTGFGKVSPAAMDATVAI
jgi:hypothetical protein